MCDNSTEQDIQRVTAHGGTINRRQFNQLLALGTLSAVMPQFAVADESIMHQEVTVKTPDGMADCLFTAPKTGTHPAIVMWPDIKGRRAAFDVMGQRLAAQGYAVLVVNPFYRDTSGAALPKGVEFPSPEAWQTLSPMREKLTQQAVVSDAQAFFAFLDEQSSVDAKRQGALMGYCMSGAFTMFAAAAMPGRIGAIASFHGGGLATDKADSPHHTVAQSDALALHAIAENDNERSPQMQPLLKEAYQAAGLTAHIEVYAETLHGWTPPDSRVYNEKQAERAWQQTLALFNQAL
ncbi:dienelactone hydrolase family protein [uncultured Alteromonas sp.]|jgi:carboxymethylenebutenolidase|uniref:dienelactone hydrolase family protein n=1 Tax=uncultured Alteromonas sp. TaxID=179113 RepID=UPI00260018FD|nr:dienelactone hydrolase family protein [uncultured Alteromonas sp.]